MRLTLRVIAIISFIAAIIWMIVAPGFEPLLAFLTGVTTLLTSFAIDKPKGEIETLNQRNRRIMLKLVEEAWINGILEKSLYGAALLDLGIKEDPDAVKYPWTIKRESNNETLPLGKPMLETFQEIGLGRSLLILGAPGSGKTTMLLELTRQLIERARQDEIEPIPVVFKLASLAEKQTITDWLATELNVFYGVSKKTAPTWVAGNKMLLLLDGLDEVKQESRTKCINAINEFRKEHGLIGIVVSSRSQEYAELNQRLTFDGAIEIQPLTSKQVTAYFNRFGKQLAGIKQILKRDTPLREMAETPLFLSIMTLAYKDIPSESIHVVGSVAEQRKHLFDTYINRMFERPDRAKGKNFKRQDVLHWLSWLAGKMIAHNQVSCLVETIQPDWLSQRKLLFLYHKLIELAVGFIFGSFSGLVTGLIVMHYSGPIAGLTLGLVMGLLGILGGEVIFMMWISGPTGGFLSNAVIRPVLLMSKDNPLTEHIKKERYSKSNKIYTVDSLVWDWKEAGRTLLFWLKPGLMMGLLLGFVIGLFVLLVNGLRNGVIVGLSLWFAAGLMFGLTGWLIGGLKVQKVEETTRPGQRLYFSIKNYLLYSVVILLLDSLVSVFFGLLVGQIGGLIFFSAVWLVIGLMGGLNDFGGIAIIQHYTLRTIIARNNLLPFRLIPFLDYCTDLIFLRRVGGGYIFVHRLLMEHFAEMYKESG